MNLEVCDGFSECYCISETLEAIEYINCKQREVLQEANSMSAQSQIVDHAGFAALSLDEP